MLRLNKSRQKKFLILRSISWHCKKSCKPVTQACHASTCVVSSTVVQLYGELLEACVGRSAQRGEHDPCAAFRKAASWEIALPQKHDVTIRRKFRSQTSDNMGRWKAEQGRGREKRKIRREKSRRERVRRKKMQMREKVGKSRNTLFFQWFVAPESRKEGSLKRRVRSQLARREMNNCTPLWREAHFEVKMYKAHHSRTAFGS